MLSFENNDSLLVSSIEAAKLLGISPRKLSQLRADGLIPSIKIGSRRLFCRASLENWIASRLEGQA